MGRGSTRAVRLARGLGLGAAIVALAAGCAVGPSVRPPVATRNDAPAGPNTPAPTNDAPPPPLLPPLVASPTGAIPFVDCTASVASAPGGDDATARGLRFGCGTVPVSGRGAAGSAELGILRVTRGPAPPTAVPIAVVGEAAGPSGGEDAIRVATQAPDDVLAGTAFYGVDLRGTGTSDPVDCVTPTRREAMTDADPTAVDPVALAPLRDAAATAARTCAQILENGLTDYRTTIAAEDLDQVRLALGAERMHAIGVGEGAGVVQAWAAQHPDAAGRLVLDGAPGPSVPSAQSAGERTTAARAALAAFATDCTARTACALGPDPVGAVTDVLSRLHATPLPGPDGRSVTDGTATTALVAGLEQPTQWPALASALARARTGDPGAPIGGTQRAMATMPQATLVTWLGAGHGAYPTTPCITAAVGSYLIDGNLPRQGTVCPP